MPMTDLYIDWADPRAPIPILPTWPSLVHADSTDFNGMYPNCFVYVAIALVDGLIGETITQTFDSRMSNGRESRQDARLPHRK